MVDIEGSSGLEAVLDGIDDGIKSGAGGGLGDTSLVVLRNGSDDSVDKQSTRHVDDVKVHPGLPKPEPSWTSDSSEPLGHSVALFHVF